MADKTTHVPFSRLVRDETLLKPRLDDDTLVRDVETVQQAYKEAVISLHNEVAEAVQNVEDPLEAGEIVGLKGERSGTFELGELLEDLSGESSRVDGGTLDDFLIQTVGEDDIPDPHFVAFAEARPFYGLQSVAGQEDHNLRHLEVQQKMQEVEEGLEKARADGDAERVAELERLFADLKADFRMGEPAPHTSNTESNAPERVTDAPPPRKPGA